jgi:hypothetical protein
MGHKIKLLATVWILSGLLAAQPVSTTNQNQHQTQNNNVGNTTTNSHNNTAAGGSATGGSATGGDSNATGGEGGQGGSASSSNGPQQNSQSSSYTSTYQQVHQVAPAIAPTPFHSAPCIKGWGAAGQSGWAGLSIGGGKVDKNCRAIETAESFAAKGKMLAYCKIMVTTQDAKAAGITMDDCMTDAKVAVPEPQAEPQPAIAPQIVVPAPQVTINLPPSAPVAEALPLPTIIPPQAKRQSHKPKASQPCKVTASK